MYHTIIRLLVALCLCLPAVAAAAAGPITQSIHVEWGYTPPSEPAVTGFKLYQEGVFACQTTDANATAMDCLVTLTAETTNFTLTATFGDGTESPHSAPFAFTTNGDDTTPPTEPPPTEPNGTGSHLIAFSWDFTGSGAVTGFRVYQNEVQICETLDPAARQLSCLTDLPEGEVTFAVSAMFSDGTETDLSNTLIYSDGETGSNPETPPAPVTELQAIIVADVVSGTTPLAVAFNASSSTGTIASYQWEFGDGEVASGVSASHTYTTAGTYTAKLTVTGGSGEAHSTVTITANAKVVSTPSSPPPTAVISSSTAAGTAPLAVSLDGSGSSVKNATIASHAWSFGDGSQASGAKVTHSFTTPGTYTATLTVTASNGLSNSVSTPIVVTGQAVATNKPPTAVIGAIPTSGRNPLLVTFDASASTDSDGNIVSYEWNFGDGASASGITATHTYTAEAVYTATLQVTDNKGAKQVANVPITVKAIDPFVNLNIELGEVSVGSEWVRVPLEQTFRDPIVVAGPPTYSDGQPCVVRLRNVNAKSFEIRLAEWNYLDGAHPAESVSYLVMERGRMTLPNGAVVEAGSFFGTTKFATIKFTNPYPKLRNKKVRAPFARTPVVMTTIASSNEADTISGRIKAVSTSSFAYYFREQEKNRNVHAREVVNFIAWEPGRGSIGSVQFEVANTAKAVTNGWHVRPFAAPFPQPPMLITQMQTTNDADPTALRVNNISAGNFEVMAEEETSKSANIRHSPEVVGFLSFDQTEE